MGNEKEVDPLSLTQRAQSYISAIDFFTPVLTSKPDADVEHLRIHICSAVFSVDEYFFLQTTGQAKLPFRALWELNSSVC